MAEQILEIKRLAEMLKEAGIPFQWDVQDYRPYFDDWRYQIFYPNMQVSIHGIRYSCSVVQGTGTYGYDDNLLEISGLLSPEEMEFDDVKGWMTAEEVFERIKKHYEGSKGNGQEKSDRKS